MGTKVIIDKIGKKPIDIDALNDTQLAVIIRVAVQQCDLQGDYSWDKLVTIEVVDEKESEE
jgi:hypothetical protein